MTFIIITFVVQRSDNCEYLLGGAGTLAFGIVFLNMI